ncbi:hypothetical protein ACS0TY_007822 [Phlomoides rotata]
MNLQKVEYSASCNVSSLILPAAAIVPRTLICLYIFFQIFMLLKFVNLNQKNIVKYLGSLKTKTHLHIILEYVENGSLANIIKPNKFGPFPESLVAVYIAQVLEGLVYLHEQGVIHRDIKGANILTTKEDGPQSRPKTI